MAVEPTAFLEVNLVLTELELTKATVSLQCRLPGLTPALTALMVSPAFRLTAMPALAVTSLVTARNRVCPLAVTVTEDTEGSPLSASTVALTK